MKRILLILAVALAATGAGQAARGAEGAPQGAAVPYKVIPAEEFAATVKNWNSDDDPHYAIITNLGEWQSEFQPTVVMGNKKPTQPEAALFNRAFLVAISRVSDAPAQGEKVLTMRSLERAGGELLLTYNFIPPVKQATYKAKNTLIVAIPIEFVENDLRIVEEIETPASRAAAAELDAAKAAGRYKPPAIKP